jgi:hypothetical protein
MKGRLLFAALAVVALGTPCPVAAQETFDRTPLLSGGWVGYPGYLHISLPYRFLPNPPGPAYVDGQPTFELAAGLPWPAAVGARYAYGSPTVPGSPDEWEVFLRYRPVSEHGPGPFDLAVTAAFNGAAGSADAEVSLSRRLGPIRLLAAGRTFTSAAASGEPRYAAAGGFVFHPFRGQLPLALAGDVASMIGPRPGERLAWSAGVQLGVSFTTHTLSLFATNTPTGTLQGVTLGLEDIRIGFELTISIPAGRFVGYFVPRAEAIEGVVESPRKVDEVVVVKIQDYLYGPGRLEIPAGTTVQ